MQSLALFLTAAGIFVAGCSAMTLSFVRTDNSYGASSKSGEVSQLDDSQLTDISRDIDSAPRFAEPKDLKKTYRKSWKACPNETFMRTLGKCHPCAACGPDLYVRHECTTEHDTICDWCLNPDPIHNSDYRLKCADVIQLQSEFNTLLEKRHRADGSKSKRLLSLTAPASSSSSASIDSGVWNAQMPMRISFIHPVYGEIADDTSVVTDTNTASLFRFARFRSLLSNSNEMGFVLQLGFYVMVIAFVYIISRIIIKARAPHYRTITVSPPVLDETDNKNIIRAADEIRGKLGKKGYNRLEEFI